MKKKTSIRILSFLMTAILVSMCFVTAMATAADNYGNGSVTFEIPAGLSGHSFAAYQIFSCVVDNGTMTNVEWGSGIDSAAFLSYLSAEGTGAYNDTMTAAQCAAAIQTVYAAADADGKAAAKALILAAAQAAKATATKTFSADTTLPRGYYLIEDTTTVQGQDKAANYAVLTYTNTNGSTSDTGSFQVKTDKPTVVKKVKEDDKEVDLIDGSNPYGAGFNDVADADIGQDVDFLLVGAVPDMSYYATYKTYTFEDTLSPNLTVSSGIQVLLSADKKVGGDAIITTYFSITMPTAENGNKLIVALKPGQDLKTIPNIASGKYILVTYSAQLNDNAAIGLPGNSNTVKLTYSNNPNWNGQGTEPTGETPPDKVIVFTYEVDVTKVDSTNSDTTLAGATFHLYYEKSASVNGYAKLADLGNGSYRFISWKDDEADATDIVTVAGGIASIIGLDDGTYWLDEIDAPTGYAPKTNPVKIEITADTENVQNWNGQRPSDVLTDITNGVSAENGNIGITIENSPIGILPETGGMGTTLFTLGGLVLMMAAAMLFVLRRRKEV